MAKSTTKAQAAPYQPKPQEKAAIEAWWDRRRPRKPSPRLKVEQKEGASAVSLDHPHPETGSILLMEALGTTSGDFLHSLLTQVSHAVSRGPAPDEDAINFMLSVVKGIEPKDEIETMLAVQMAAVHMAAMTLARRLNHTDTIPQQDSAERAFNKLARTFTTQMEALKRYRTGGQQKVIVEHVTVNAGGQAIVGAVETGGGVATKREGQPHAKQLSHASEPPLWGQDEERERVPLARDAER